MLEKFLELIEENIDERKANIYLSRATTSILKLTNRTLEDINDGLEDLIVDLAVYRYEMRKTTHLKSENYDGASFNYGTDIPDFLLREIKAYKKMRVF